MSLSSNRRLGIQLESGSGIIEKKKATTQTETRKASNRRSTWKQIKSDSSDKKKTVGVGDGVAGDG